ncbi:hypothetical protein NW762_011722 [Fusarium torreyae]|uniref:Uncharacterized protein n=1 Tax=Fusarium torreyae TaxID=1237075 RepID=A0A9W8V9M6_9HYPO|nr:hypothetical protein NW762_011722 [Fusarium torreyae]
MEDPRDHYGAIDSSFYPPQDRNPRGYFGSQNYGPQSYDLQKPLLKYPTPDILESKGLSKTYTIPAARRRKTAQNQDTSNTEWERFLTDWDEGTLTLRLVHNSEYSVYKDGREKINLVCPSSSSDSSANTRPLQMRWLLVLKMPFIAQELRQIAMTILEDIEKTSTAPAKDNGPRQQLVDTFRGIGRYDDHPLSETEPVIFLSSPYLALGEAIAHSGLDKDHGSVGLLQSLYGFDISSTQYTEEVIRKMKIGSSKDMIRIPQLWCLVIGSGLMITYSELSLTDLFGNLIHVDPNTSILEQPMNVRVEDEKQRQYNIVIDGKSSFVDFLQDAVALCRRPGTEVSDYELFIDSETKVTPQKWLDLVKTSHVEVVIFYVRFKGRYEGLRRAPHYMYDGYDMMPYGVPIPPPSPEVPSKPPLRRKALRRQQKNRQTNLVQATSIKERTVKPRSLSGHKIQHPPKSMQQVNRRQPRRPRRPRETVHTSAHKPTRINERVLNDVIIVRGKAQIFEGDSSTDDETKTPTTTNERAGLHDSNASQEQIGEDSSEESLVSSAEDSNLGETERPSNEELDLLRLTILPAETVSIQAMEHLDLPFYFSENKVVIQRLLSQEQIDELFRLGQEATTRSSRGDRGMIMMERKFQIQIPGLSEC